MKLLTFQTEDGLRLGVKTDQGVIDVNGAAPAEIPATIDALFENGAASLVSLRNFIADLRDSDALGQNPFWLLNEQDLTFGPCVPTPQKIICVGKNYALHAEETGSTAPQNPILFSKFNNALAAHQEPVPLPPISEQYDYEAELAVVIGETVRDVSEEVALDYVFGYCCACDFSCRDLQKLTSQWLLGKSLDKFLPLGPYLVTSDEVPAPQNLNITCHVNGEQRQNANTQHMIFSIPFLISYISRHFTLRPGDVIVTGTPEGVALGMTPPPWLKAGDTVVVQVEGLGRLENRMVAYDQ